MYNLYRNLNPITNLINLDHSTLRKVVSYETTVIDYEIGIVQEETTECLEDVMLRNELQNFCFEEEKNDAVAQLKLYVSKVVQLTKQNIENTAKIEKLTAENKMLSAQVEEFKKGKRKK